MHCAHGEQLRPQVEREGRAAAGMRVKCRAPADGEAGAPLPGAQFPSECHHHLRMGAVAEKRGK